MEDDRFWRTIIIGRDAAETAGLWKLKRAIARSTQIVTLGSYFMLYFSRVPIQRRYRWLNCEPGLAGPTPERQKDCHYGTCTPSVGSIYTPKILPERSTSALTDSLSPSEVWESGGYFPEKVQEPKRTEAGKLRCKYEFPVAFVSDHRHE